MPPDKNQIPAIASTLGRMSRETITKPHYRLPKRSLERGGVARPRRSLCKSIQRAAPAALAVCIMSPLTTTASAEVLVFSAEGQLQTYETRAHLVAFEPVAEPKRDVALKATTTPHVTPRKATPAVSTAIRETALRYATHAGLRKAELSSRDWLHLFQANIEIESGYNQSARSHAGAIGLGQLMPGTARQLNVNPDVMAENLDGSARYLLGLLEDFGTPSLALAAYNAGPDAVKKHGGIPPYPETQGHVRKVLAVWSRLRS